MCRALGKTKAGRARFNRYINDATEMNERMHGRGLESSRDSGRWKLPQLLFAVDTDLVTDTEARLRGLVTEFSLC